MIIYRLKKKIFPDLQELTEYLVSAVMAVSFKPCAAPSGRTNVYFVYYQFAPMNYHLLQRKHRFSRNQNLDIQRVNENEILCQNYLVLSIFWYYQNYQFTLNKNIYQGQYFC